MRPPPICLVLDAQGRELARGPIEQCLPTMNRLAAAVCCVREHDRALLATPLELPRATRHAWLASLDWLVS